MTLKYNFVTDRFDARYWLITRNIFKLKMIIIVASHASCATLKNFRSVRNERLAMLRLIDWTIGISRILHSSRINARLFVSLIPTSLPARMRNVARATYTCLLLSRDNVTLNKINVNATYKALTWIIHDGAYREYASLTFQSINIK
ncbi:hypothetical protein PUN28_007150 [Cardiocondyla obscurior]|uniref:Uncharacterized protein n=1 Tax=Cardiocondyla obscurior TaxID=286306 RepID=A0AAW2G1R5_9HYME